MQFNAEQYFRVSLERMEQSLKLYHSGSRYALAIYCGGLAVESLLRAIRWAKDPSFEGRHDLLDLLKSSELLRIDEEHAKSKGKTDEAVRAAGNGVRAAMNEIVPLWHNNLRFASEESLKSHLRKIGRLSGIKGDPLKKNALDFLTAAQTVIARGDALLISRKR